jgi:hypothetical protein
MIRGGRTWLLRVIAIHPPLVVDTATVKAL